MAATITKAVLSDLHKGNARIKLLPEVTSMDGIDFTSADELFTLQDSFQIVQGEPTLNEIKIDQYGEPTIDIDVEKGEFSLQGTIPSTAKAVLDYFFTQVGSTVIITSETGKTFSGQGYSDDVKQVVCSVLVESETRKSAFFFTKVRFTANVDGSDVSQPVGIPFVGSIMVPTTDGLPTFVKLSEATE